MKRLNHVTKNLKQTVKRPSFKNIKNAGEAPNNRISGSEVGVVYKALKTRFRVPDYGFGSIPDVPD